MGNKAVDGLSWIEPVLSHLMISTPGELHLEELKRVVAVEQKFLGI